MHTLLTLICPLVDSGRVLWLDRMWCVVLHIAVARHLISVRIHGRGCLLFAVPRQSALGTATRYVGIRMALVGQVRCTMVHVDHEVGSAVQVLLFGRRMMAIDLQSFVVIMLFIVLRRMYCNKFMNALNVLSEITRPRPKWLSNPRKSQKSQLIEAQQSVTCSRGRAWRSHV